MKLPVVPSTAPSTSLSSPRGFLFPQIAASTLMRYCSSFNSKIYSTARRLIQFINKPQCIHIPALILQTPTVPYNPVQTSFHVSKKSLGFFGQFDTQKMFWLHAICLLSASFHAEVEWRRTSIIPLDLSCVLLTPSLCPLL